MFRRKGKKEKDRYYLLPGQGGKRALRRKKLMMLKWAVPVGILLSIALGLALYYFYKRFG